MQPSTAHPAGATQPLLLAWYDAHRRDLPWRRTRDPYAILISEVMLQQTQVDRVIPKYHEFLARFPTLHALAAATPAEVIRAWAPLGYNRRAVNLHRLAVEVVRSHGGALPADVRALRRLPGVGAYTAAAVACFAFGLPQPVVDTNVARVLSRLQRRPPDGEAAVRRLAADYLPLERAADWNQALMDLGATICRAASPLCLLCPLRSVCPSSGRTFREERAAYVTRPAQPFRGSDRYLRGRIVDRLRAAPPDGCSVDALAVSLDLADETGRAHLARLIAALERDGLIVTDTARGAVRLPS